MGVCRILYIHELMAGPKVGKQCKVGLSRANVSWRCLYSTRAHG